MASMGEMVAMEDRLGASLQELESEISALRERVTALEGAKSARKPEAVVETAAPVAAPADDPVPEPAAEPEVTEEDLAAYRGKRGRKPPHIQKALDAEKASEAA